jgi:hypothetical protein
MQCTVGSDETDAVELLPQAWLFCGHAASKGDPRQ